MSHLLPDPSEGLSEAFNCFRLDNGKVIATNRMFMAVEEVEPFEGVFYIRPTAALLNQCRIEAEWSSVISFTPVPSIQYTTAITSMGFTISDNIGVWPSDTADYDGWYDRIVVPCLDPLTTSTGPLTIHAPLMNALALASPSGKLVLEQYFDPYNRPCAVRDADAHHWVGFFRPKMKDAVHHVAASVPAWCR